MKIEFTQPLFLLALVPLLVHACWMARRLSSLSRGRRAGALALRVLILSALVCALAGLRFARETRDLTVVYALDQSDSVPPTQRELARAFVRKTLGEMKTDDRAGVIAFGKEAAVELSPEARLAWQEPKAVFDHSRSNLAGAIELAKACYIGQGQRRLVLLTDGNQNMGDALEAARSASAAGIAIDIFPLKYENRNDVILEKVVVENRVSLDAPFDIKVIASSRRAGKARLSLHQDGKLMGQPFEVDLTPGKKNVYTVSTQVRDAGFHAFEAQLDVEGDQIPENNRGYASTYGAGEPHVLFVDGDERHDPLLPALLQSEKINLTAIEPSALPRSLRDLQGYDSIIFNNVSAGDLTADQMKMIERAVHDLGVGFIMVGGDHSFGAGGYKDTPIERILPVEMDIKNEKVLPQGALVPIIHTVEIPEGQYWAEAIVHSALDVLAPRDLMGVLFYNWQGGEDWLFKLQEVGDKKRLHSIISSIQPGDMPSFDRTLQMAHDALVGCGASVRHIVIISDGDPQTPNPALAKKIRDARISISTVCINPHSPRDVSVMQDLARLGGGNFYNVASYNNLPQIFVKEAATVRKSLIIEEPFTPAVRQGSPLLAGVGPGYPGLRGYVGTTAKPLADVPLVTHHDDPLFAHWRHGLGKTVAFTSDAKARWATAWSTWPQMGKFWAQAVRWSLRDPFNQNYQVQMDIDGARGRVIVDAVDSANKFRDLLQIGGRIITPSLEPLDVSFRQTAPGRYEATFDAAQPGAYMLGAVASEPGAAAPNAGQGQSASGDLVTGAATLSYSPEFQQSRSNESLIYQVADLTGGRVLSPESPVFLRDRRVYSQPQWVWPLLLKLALILFLIDVFIRRVLVSWGDMGRGLARAWRWSTARLRPRSTASTETASQLLQVKQDVRQREGLASSAPADAAWREALLSGKPDSSATGSEAASPLDELKQATRAEAPRKKPAPEGDKPTDKPKAGEPPQGFTGQLLQARRKTRQHMNRPNPPEQGDK